MKGGTVIARIEDLEEGGQDADEGFWSIGLRLAKKLKRKKVCC